MFEFLAKVFVRSMGDKLRVNENVDCCNGLGDIV